MNGNEGKGRRYGFERFKGVRDTQQLQKKLDSMVGENKSWQKETTAKEVQQHTATEVVLLHHMLLYVC